MKMIRTVLLASIFALALCAHAETEKTDTAVPSSEPASKPSSKPTAEEQRRAIDDMRSDTLGRLFDAIPDARAILEDSAGYAIFSNKGMNLLLLSTARGAGLLRDHRDGSDTYMKVVGAGTGVGAGLTSYITVLVFQSEAALDDFREKGWELTGQADAHSEASAATAEPGKELPATVGPDVLVYQMTDSGFALQALVQGFRYWADPALND